MKQDWHYSANINEGGILEVDYDHGLSVWRTFQKSIIGAYFDLYMQTDISFCPRCLISTDCSLTILYCSGTGKAGSSQNNGQYLEMILNCI